MNASHTRVAPGHPSALWPYAAIPVRSEREVACMKHTRPELETRESSTNYM